MKSPVEINISEITYPLFILKGDCLVFDEDVSFHSVQDLLDYIETGMTEEQRSNYLDNNLDEDL